MSEEEPKPRLAGKKKRAASIGYEHEIQIRVRYQETDQMGVVYHGNYFTYFEMGRTELLRAATGVSYRDVEDHGGMLVVVKVECAYIKPALYDDLLTLKTRVAKISQASIEHEHELYCDGELLVKGRVKLAYVSKEGKIIPVPDWIRDLTKPGSATDESATVGKDS